MTLLYDPRPLDPPEYWEHEPPPEPRHWLVELYDGTEHWIPEHDLEENLLHFIATAGAAGFHLHPPR